GEAEGVRDGGVPTGSCGEEVSRLLAMAEVPEEELNPFQVLGVEATASDAELKKAYRRLAVLVHPDKNEHPRAEAAFKVLRAAWDMVSTPERRKEYEIAEEGDFWAESSLLGLKITYFAMMDGKIYDITEWAGCQRVGISPDTHRVPYHISF
ncbi:DJC14 protein, partial [Sagittarius serpentarius]|nr:DJC14 protein [Sagittarius serpentarius]